MAVGTDAPNGETQVLDEFHPDAGVAVRLATLAQRERDPIPTELVEKDVSRGVLMTYLAIKQFGPIRLHDLGHWGNPGTTYPAANTLHDLGLIYRGTDLHPNRGDWVWTPDADVPGQVIRYD